jgi:hypothetical protein
MQWIWNTWLREIRDYKSILISTIGVTSKCSSLVITSHISPLHERLQCAVHWAILHILSMSFLTIRFHINFKSWRRWTGSQIYIVKLNWFQLSIYRILYWAYNIYNIVFVCFYMRSYCSAAHGSAQMNKTRDSLKLCHCVRSITLQLCCTFPVI